MATTENPREAFARDATHDQLVTLLSWLAEVGESAKTLAYAAEKPWKYSEELSLALAVEKHELERIRSARFTEIQPASDGSGRWVCGAEWVDGVEQFCDWEWVPA